MSREIERRSVAGSIEIRAQDGKKKLVGYAALYDSPSADLGGFTEIIRAGAFDRAIRENQEVLARAEHDTRLLLGRRSSGTCVVTADAKGLRYEVDVPDTQVGRDLLTLVERGDIRGSSFAFSIPDPDKDQRWTKTETGQPLRELLNLDLYDVAPTADPAYPATSVSARALERAKEMTMEIPNTAAAELRQRALARVHARTPKEKRDQSYEDRMEAIYAALYKLLGSPWDSESAWWCIEATFDDHVIVERFDGARRLLWYPMTFTNGAPAFGDPVPVEEQYVPVVAAEGDRGPAKAAPPAPPAEADPEMDQLRAELG